MAEIIKRGERTWLVRVFRGRDASGKRLFVNKTVKGTKKDAQLWAAQTETSISTGTYREPSKQTVGEYLDAWLSGTAAQKVRPQTLASYTKLVKLYVRPSLGDTRLTQLALPQVERFYRELSAKDLSARTVRYVHSVLRGALTHAVKARLLSHNPTDYATLPRQQSEEMRFLSPEESERFLAAAADDEWFAFWALLLTTGLRPSEALGLKWADIEPDKIRIQRTVVQGNGGWRFDECKTTKARRTVTLPKSTELALRAHRKRQAEARLKAGSAFIDHDLVFASSTGGPPDLRSLTRCHFNRILNAAELSEIRLYDLRHTHASALLASGVPVKVVSERLGHASAKMTLDVYAHVTAAQHEGMADTVERLFYGSNFR